MTALVYGCGGPVSRDRQVGGSSTPTSGLRLLMSSTQTPAGSGAKPRRGAAGSDSEARPPGRAGTVRPAQGKDTGTGESGRPRQRGITAEDLAPSRLLSHATWSCSDSNWSYVSAAGIKPIYFQDFFCSV